MRKLKLNFEKRVLIVKGVGIGYGLNSLKTNNRTSKRPYEMPKWYFIVENCL